jgi:hypothetical protein
MVASMPRATAAHQCNICGAPRSGDPPRLKEIVLQAVCAGCAPEVARIEALRAGRECDALVAEAVFGERPPAEIQPYSTSWKAALRVLDRVGGRVTVDGAGRPAGCTTRQRGDGRFEVWLEEDAMGALSAVGAETFEMALSRAVLLRALADRKARRS